MKKSIYIILFFLFIFNSVFSNKIEKAYKAYLIYDFFKAKKLATSSFKKNKDLSSLLLASIFYRNDNPFSNIDSAYKYIEIATHSNLSSNSVLFLKKFQFDTTYLKQLKEKIHNQLFKQFFLSGISFSDKDAEKFLCNYPEILYKQQVLFKRDSVVFHEAIKEKSSLKMQVILNTYPESFFKKQIIEQIDFFRYKEFVSDENPKKIERFIFEFPNSKYITNAEDDLFEIAMMSKNKTLLHRYILLFSENSNIEEAWKLLYSLEITNYSENALENFILKYPDFPYKKSIEKELELSKQIILIAKENEKYGCVNELGDTIIPFIYDGIEQFKQGIALVEKDNFFGFIKLTGDALTPLHFDDAESFNEDRAIVNKNGNSYAVDRSGNTISSSFDALSDFNYGLSIVKKNNLYGAINKNGKIEIPLQFQMMGEFSEGICYAQKNEKFGYIDKNGYTLIPFVFDWAENFKNGFARVKKNNLYGLINLNGEYIIQPIFERIEEEINGVFMVIKNNQYGFIDASGCYLSQLNNKLIDGADKKNYTNGNWMKLFDGVKINLMNKNGKFISEKNGFDDISLPECGLFRFLQDKKYGFLNSKGKIVIKPGYDETTFFDDSVCIARKKNTFAIINTKGDVLFSVKTPEMKRVSKDIFIYQNENNEFNYCTRTGNVFLTCKLDNPKFYLNRFLIWDDDLQTKIFDLNTNKLIFGQL